MKISLAKLKRSKPWTIKELDTALSDLKRNKPRDCEGLVNEIFKNDIIGTDLKDSLLLIFNGLKSENLMAEFLNFANVITVPKGKMVKWVPGRGRVVEAIFGS